MLTGFLLGAVSMFMVFRMFETMNRDSREYSNVDKWAEIFGMCMIWLLAIGVVLLISTPSDTATVTATTNYSAAGIK